MAKKPILCEEGEKLYEIWNSKCSEINRCKNLDIGLYFEENKAYNNLKKHVDGCRGCLRIGE